jgi:hypothetical protein
LQIIDAAKNAFLHSNGEYSDVDLVLRIGAALGAVVVAIVVAAFVLAVTAGWISEWRRDRGRRGERRALSGR